MMSRDGKADLPVYLESSRRSEEAKGWGPQGIGWREDYAAVIDARSVWCRRGTLEGKVPLK